MESLRDLQMQYDHHDVDISRIAGRAVCASVVKIQALIIILLFEIIVLCATRLHASQLRTGVWV